MMGFTTSSMVGPHNRHLQSLQSIQKSRGIESEALRRVFRASLAAQDMLPTHQQFSRFYSTTNNNFVKPPKQQQDEGSSSHSDDQSSNHSSNRKASFGMGKIAVASISLATLATISYILYQDPKAFSKLMGTSMPKNVHEAEQIYTEIMRNRGMELRGDKFEDVYNKEENLEIVENHKSYEQMENIIDLISEADGAPKKRGFIARIFHGFRLFFRAMFLVWKFLPLAVWYPYVKNKNTEDLWMWYYERILKVFRESGALFIKLGQWAATRPDLIDRNLAQVLQALHYEGQTHTFVETKRTIERAYGKKLEDIFEEFDPELKGSGAIAQVYMAKLRPEYMPQYTEEELENTPKNNLILSPVVAVKVKHPSVDRNVGLDLELLQMVCRAISKVEQYRYMSIEENMLTFANGMRDQLDMRVEAHNLLIFNDNFKDIRNITFPNPVMSLCSDPTVLVESWEEGTDVNKFVELPHDEVHKDLRISFAQLGITTYLKMLILDNMLHGDMHSGNLKVQVDPETGKAVLVVLDAGLVFSLKKKDRRKLIDIFMALSDKNGQKLASTMCSSDEKFRDFFNKKTGNPDDVRRLECYEREMQEFIEECFSMENKKVRVGESFTNCLDIGRRYQIPMESVFSGIIIATAIIEGLGRRLDPNMSFVDDAKPLLKLCLHSDLMEEYFSVRFGRIKGTVARSLFGKLLPGFSS